MRTNMKQIVWIMALLLLSTVVAATEVNIVQPVSKQVFETNDPVYVTFNAYGNGLLKCTFDEKGSSRFLSEDDAIFYYYSGTYTLWWIANVNSNPIDFNMYNGQYKLQIICVDSQGSIGKSDVLKIKVKGDLKRP